MVLGKGQGDKVKILFFSKEREVNANSHFILSVPDINLFFKPAVYSALKLMGNCRGGLIEFCATRFADIILIDGAIKVRNPLNRC